jgi:hypothetical protein
MLTVIASVLTGVFQKVILGNPQMSSGVGGGVSQGVLGLLNLVGGKNEAPAAPSQAAPQEAP